MLRKVGRIEVVEIQRRSMSANKKRWWDQRLDALASTMFAAMIEEDHAKAERVERHEETARNLGRANADALAQFSKRLGL